MTAINQSANAEGTLRAGAAPEFPAFAKLVSKFPSVSLDEMEDVELLSRTDTKFLLSTSDLSDLFQGLVSNYQALEIDGSRLHRYMTTYFDTNDMDFYLRHHAGDQVRDKVRLRRYLDSGLAFLEVKHKSNKGVTDKERISVAGESKDIRRQMTAILKARFQGQPPEGLHPTVDNEFTRVTLIDLNHSERVTIDFDLRFSMNGQAVDLPGVAIVEVKQSGHNKLSLVLSSMRAFGMSPERISKYCLGVALLDEGVKHNAFKPKLLAIKKLMRGPSHG